MVTVTMGSASNQEIFIKMKTKTMKHLEEKIEQHKKFLEFSDVDRPLCGCCIGGWENLGRYLKDSDNLFHQGYNQIDKVNTLAFTKVYKRYVKNMDYDDDLIRCIEPFQSIPWCEAAKCALPIC